MKYIIYWKILNHKLTLFSFSSVLSFFNKGIPMLPERKSGRVSLLVSPIEAEQIGGLGVKAEEWLDISLGMLILDEQRVKSGRLLLVWP